MANEATPLNDEYTTLPSGKEIGIFKVANTSLYRIAFIQGGQVPKELDGMWTDQYKAQMAIKGYVENRRLEAEKAKTVKEK